jgi:hypothetical protein
MSMHLILSQGAAVQSLIQLRDIAAVERTDLKPYCLLVDTKDKKIWMSLKNDDELYGWLDDIYRCQ